VKLGDSHNFGRRVAQKGRRIVKPRTVLWEWLVLCPESPLRKALAAAATDERQPGAFEFLPSLRFFASKQAFGGEVERLELSPLGKLSPSERRELARATGRALALFSWLGVADLHW
jgi:hypothetical protein